MEKINLGLTVDLGASLTKIVGGISKKKYLIFEMEPEVVEIDRWHLGQYQNNTYGATGYENRAWAGLNDKYYAVGYLAQSQFNGMRELKKLKVERGIIKILAAVWVLSEYFQLGSSFNLALSCLLPPGEFQVRDKFQADLTEALSSFMSPSGIKQIKLVAFDCKPEGGGVFLQHYLKMGQKLSEITTGILMLGYRNASVFLCNRGMIGDYQTSELGMVVMLKAIVANTSGYSAEKLLLPIVRAGEDLNEQPLIRVLRSTEDLARERELAELKQAISSARVQYASLLRDWIQEVLPREVEEMVICGGTADFLRTEIRQILDIHTLYWHANAGEEDEKLLNKGNRFADVWCYWQYFQERFVFQRQAGRPKKIVSTVK